MLHELDDTTSLWLQDPVKNWREWPVAAATAADAAAVKDKASAVDAGGLLDKVNEDKLARDVDDLSAIFEELADGVIDFPLPSDDDDEDDDLAEATAVVSTDDGVGEWIDGLDSEDALNVDEISEAFDALVAEQEDAMSAVDALLKQKDDETAPGACYSSSEYDDSDEDMDEDEDDTPVSLQFVPAPPVWATMAPLDPRSCITTPVFKNLDARIPRISIPRMDLALRDVKADDATPAVAVFRPVGPTVACLSPARKEAKAAAAVPEYRHDPATCWICKSSKTPERKRALHRFLEKRSRRNWKKGPRYSGRSNVAASRVRNGGRFICTTQWI